MKLPTEQQLRVLLFLRFAGCHIMFPTVGIAERSRQEETVMAKHSHLTLSERIEIEKALRDRTSFSEIGTSLGKDPSTISKEVRNHFIIKDGGSRCNPCLYRNTCSTAGISALPASISGRKIAPNAVSLVTRSAKTSKRNSVRGTRSRRMSATAVKSGSAAHFAVTCMTPRPLRKSTRLRAARAVKE